MESELIDVESETLSIRDSILYVIRGGLALSAAVGMAVPAPLAGVMTCGYLLEKYYPDLGPMGVVEATAIGVGLTLSAGAGIAVWGLSHIWIIKRIDNILGIEPREEIVD